ncbi:MAG: hypothetical protein ACK4OO_07240 [bacterium]
MRPLSILSVIVILIGVFGVNAGIAKETPIAPVQADPALFALVPQDNVVQINP